MVSEQHRSRSVAEIDRLADEIKKASSKQALSGRDDFERQCWIFTGRQSCKSYGFVAMAAAFGGPAFHYVRTKIIAEPACYTVEGNERDLLWPIVLRTGSMLGILACPSLEVAAEISTFDAGERFEIAELWIQYALKGTRDRAALLSKLANLHKDLLYRTGLNLPLSYFEGTEEYNYKDEMLRMLRRYGVGSSWKGRLRRARFVVEDLFQK
ncbi:hypothetical protein B0T09DRAFT_184532 [Sordaria sp. MPI-SDFR-AT-0083]|nr:hypothetical protein B0T09DRAFT_184532 [Sordaria sp. MPI-SDFR-AT-0083]